VFVARLLELAKHHHDAVRVLSEASRYNTRRSRPGCIESALAPPRTRCWHAPSAPGATAA